MGWFRADRQACEAFEQHGFWLQPALLSPPEIEALRKYAKEDQQLATRATSRSDAQGGTTTLALENTLGTDPYSSVARLRRIVEPMERFLGDEVYHYHHKMMLKEPRVGGAWEWHQDYGYWYNFGCLFPTMASCYVAIDRATKENGCLQIIAGSHAMGRIEHGKVGGQTGGNSGEVPGPLCRDAARGCPLLPRKPAPSIRPEHQRASQVGADLLLQHEKQQPLQTVASSFLRTTECFGRRPVAGPAHPQQLAIAGLNPKRGK
jgi:hypothetical protein